MDDPDEASEIWFEPMGPTIGWVGSYMPVTMMGFYVLLAHTLPVLLLWVLPLSLLGHFEIVPGGMLFGFAVPVVVGSLLLLMRTAYRHSRPWRG